MRDLEQGRTGQPRRRSADEVRAKLRSLAIAEARDRHGAGASWSRAGSLH